MPAEAQSPDESRPTSAIPVAAVSGKNLGPTASESEYSEPVRPIVYRSVAIASSDRRRFIEEMESFAEKHQFAIRTGAADPAGVNLLIQMWREDFKVIVNNPFNPDTFNIGIYPTCSDKVPADVANSLMSEILEMVSGMNGSD